MSPHLSNSNLKCQHVGKATAGATSCPGTLMQCDPCQAPQNKAPGCPPAAAAPSPCLWADQAAPQQVPLVWLGAVSPSQGQGEALQLLRFCSRDACSHTCFSIIAQSYTLHQPLAILLHSPKGCSRLVHVCSSWSLCCPIEMLVMLSKNAAVHGYAWFTRSTVLPGQGQETNPPCWEGLSRRLKPFAACWGRADVICSIRLGNKVVAWEQQ